MSVFWNSNFLAVRLTCPMLFPALARKPGSLLRLWLLLNRTLHTHHHQQHFVLLIFVFMKLNIYVYIVLSFQVGEGTWIRSMWMTRTGQAYTVTNIVADEQVLWGALTLPIIVLTLFFLESSGFSTWMIHKSMWLDLLRSDSWSTGCFVPTLRNCEIRNTFLYLFRNANSG